MLDLRGIADRERSEILATVSHELRTPLTSICGYIETLLDGELDPLTTRRFLETARREALRLGRFVEGMLEFSMLDLTTPVIPIESVIPSEVEGRRPYGSGCDVAEQIRATIDAAIPLAHDRNVTIRARLPKAAPARIDGDACVHALLILAENAIKHGKQNGVVEISCTRVGPFIRICVDDDGPGIAPSEREAIFGLGTRGRAVRRPGAGIGLAVVRAIADRAGGDVHVRRSPFGGARFLLRLPAG